MRVEIRELQRKLGLTTVMVTHDQEEALTMADRLVVMTEGAVRQVGSAARPLRAPGRPLRRRLRRPHAPSSKARVEAPGALPHARAASALACNGGGAGPAALALRPERLTLDAAPRPALDNSLPGAVEFVSYLGAADRHACAPVAERPA